MNFWKIITLIAMGGAVILTSGCASVYDAAWAGGAHARTHYVKTNKYGPRYNFDVQVQTVDPASNSILVAFDVEAVTSYEKVEEYIHSHTIRNYKPKVLDRWQKKEAVVVERQDLEISAIAQPSCEYTDLDFQVAMLSGNKARVTVSNANVHKDFINLIFKYKPSNKRITQCVNCRKVCG